MAPVLRNLIYRWFYRTASPPSWATLARVMGVSREEVAAFLRESEDLHDLVLIRDTASRPTDHILMAHPFAAVATPHSVVLERAAVDRAVDAIDAAISDSLGSERWLGEAHVTRTSHPAAWFGN
mmetsp:Transcript_32397/g.84796  ORF Transcript_32397/g.84796 Transcript_32397/m.84796 type:complete len:124 (+) Transcript_32397:79-450(+)